jgi:hypothetical protein
MKYRKALFFTLPLFIAFIFSGGSGACDENKISLSHCNVSKELYSIDVTYPQIISTKTGSSCQKFNSLVENHVKEAINQFSTCLCNKMKDKNLDIRFMREHPWSLKIDSKTGINTSRIISILLSGDVFAGYIHNQQFYTTYTYDLVKGKALELNHLFKKNVKCYEVISNYCVDQLTKDYFTEKSQRHPKGFEESKREVSYEAYYLHDITYGASPEEENFRYFYLDSKHIVIIFPPYKIGPYAAGMHKVSIPCDSIKNSLNPEYEKYLFQ